MEMSTEWKKTYKKIRLWVDRGGLGLKGTSKNPIAHGKIERGSELSPQKSINSH